MEIVIILLLILLNGVLSMSEIALVSARKSRLEAEAKGGSRQAATALRLSNEPDRFLSTIQIGITLIGILTGLYSGEKFAYDFAAVIARVDFLAPYSVGIAKTVIVIIVTYLTLIFGELVPKRMGMSRAERISKVLASPMYILSKIATPLVWLLSKSTSGVVKILGIKEDESKVTEEEIKAIIKEGMDDGEVQEVEHDIMERVFSLGDRDLGSIMTHRSDIAWLDINDGPDEIKRKVMEDMHDVYPVQSGTTNRMVGAVYMKDLFGRVDGSDFSLEKLIKQPYYMPETQSVYAALEQFKKEDVKCGFIIDEFGEVVGIVTLKDILEALVGQVYEDDGDADIVVREDGSLLVDGQYSFYDFLEYYDKEYLYSENDHNTLSGLILELLEHVPVAGEKVSWEGFDFEIMDMDGARIDKVMVRYNGNVGQA